jgi:hypothetical protein
MVNQLETEEKGLKNIFKTWLLTLNVQKRRNSTARPRLISRQRFDLPRTYGAGPGGIVT